MNPPLVMPPRPAPRDSGLGIRDSESGTGSQQLKIDVEKLSFFYGEKRALEDISIKIQPNVVTAFIGPSGCGKSDTYIVDANGSWRLGCDMATNGRHVRYELTRWR